MSGAGPSSTQRMTRTRDIGGKMPPAPPSNLTFESAFETFSNAVSGLSVDQQTPTNITTLALMHGKNVSTVDVDPEKECTGTVEVIPSFAEVTDDELELYSFLREWCGKPVSKEELQRVLVPVGVTNIRIKYGELHLVCAKFTGFKIMTEHAMDLGPFSPTKEFFRFIANILRLNLCDIARIDEFVTKDASAVQSDYLLGIEQVESLSKQGVFEKISTSRLNETRAFFADLGALLKRSQNDEIEDGGGAGDDAEIAKDAFGSIFSPPAGTGGGLSVEELCGMENVPGGPIMYPL